MNAEKKTLKEEKATIAESLSGLWAIKNHVDKNLIGETNGYQVRP